MFSGYNLQGVLESLIIGEVRLCTQRSSRQSQNNELARNCVLQILVYDAEVVLRENSKQKFQKGRHQKRRPSGRGKWMIFTNIAKYVTVSVAELLVQVIAKLNYYLSADLLCYLACCKLWCSYSGVHVISSHFGW